MELRNKRFISGIIKEKIKDVSMKMRMGLPKKKCFALNIMVLRKVRSTKTTKTSLQKNY